MLPLRVFLAAHNGGRHLRVSLLRGQICYFLSQMRTLSFTDADGKILDAPTLRPYYGAPVLLFEKFLVGKVDHRRACGGVSRRPQTYLC